MNKNQIVWRPKRTRKLIFFFVQNLLSLNFCVDLPETVECLRTSALYQSYMYIKYNVIPMVSSLISYYQRKVCRWSLQNDGVITVSKHRYNKKKNTNVLNLVHATLTNQSKASVYVYIYNFINIYF